MSIDIDWEKLTGGEDGAALAESIRLFVDDRFQQVTLPRFIRSVKVHSFDFGTVAPEMELKDICDPLPDFYDDDSSDEAEDRESPQQTRDNAQSGMMPPPRKDPDPTALKNTGPQRPSLNIAALSSLQERQAAVTNQASTPGIPGGTSNFSYFHMPLGSGLSGHTTPLSAVAPHFGAHWPEQWHSTLHQSTSHQQSNHLSGPASSENSAHCPQDGQMHNDRTPSPPATEPTANDVQIVSHLRYSGDIRLSLTAEILLDYPMQSFVGIPLKLNVTGLTFDGVAILAYIKHKAHFCFLAPDDANALIGGGESDSDDSDHDRADAQWAKDTMADKTTRKPIGGLFEEIKVESEIGRKTNGKQVLKNIGKVEGFVLEQVRRIFEAELVYPSFWTFLV